MSEHVDKFMIKLKPLLYYLPYFKTHNQHVNFLGVHPIPHQSNSMSYVVFP